jgi:hypothetical protein
LELKEKEGGAKYYAIATPDDLLAFAAIINSTTETPVTTDAILEGDIDMTDIVWTTMNPDKSYSGTFDGNNHTIELKNKDKLGGQTVGLFRTITSGVVKNLVVSADFEIGGSSNIGGVARTVRDTTIENVTVNGSISGGSVAAGLVASSMGTSNYLRCVNNADISSTVPQAIGGLIANNTDTTTPGTARIEYCANYGDITSNFNGAIYTGGLVGQNRTTLVVSNSYNAGKVSTPICNFTSTNYIGGLVGGGSSTSSIKIINSFNYGAVTLFNNATPNGAVIFGAISVTKEQAMAILSNDLYLNGSGGMLFGSGTSAVTGSAANGTDGWGTDEVKALVAGKTTEEFADGTVLALLNAGPGGKNDLGDLMWEGGVLYPILAGLADGPPPDEDEDEDVDDGGNDEVFRIVTSSDLLEFAGKVRDRKIRLKAQLEDNIVFTDGNWQAIASSDPYEMYNGTFDGRGFSITGLSGAAGFFGTIGTDGVIKDLHLKEVNLSVGGVTAKNYGRIERVTVSGTVGTASYSEYVGGIAAENYGTISRSANYADVRTGYYGGGIAARTGSASSVKYSANYGSVSGRGAEGYSGSAIVIGGLAGRAVGSFSNCYNVDSVAAANNQNNDDHAGDVRVGGLFGESWVVAENCFNYGTVRNGGNGYDESKGGYAISGGNQSALTINSTWNNIWHLDGVGVRHWDWYKPAAYFAPDGALLAALNDGPGGTIDGEPQWKQGKNYPELADFFVEWKPPVLIEVEAVRTGTESATVTFTSDEDGSYRYAVTDGSVPEDDDYNGWLELFRDREMPIELTGLTSGVNYIHIQLKDADENVSEALAIRIPGAGVGEIPAEKPGIVASEDILPNIKDDISKGISEGKNVELVAPEAITEKMLLDDDTSYLRWIGILPAEGDDDTMPAAAKIDVESGVLVANKEALLKANTGEDAVKIVESTVIELPILEAEITNGNDNREKMKITAVTALSVPLGDFANGFNTAGDVVLLKLKPDRSVTALRRVSGVSEIDHGLYAVTDGEGEPIPDGDLIDADGVYLVVVGIRNNSELDWDTDPEYVVDPLYTALGSGGSDPASGSGGCSAGLPGAFVILAALAAAYRVKRGDE